MHEERISPVVHMTAEWDTPMLAALCGSIILILGAQ